MKIYKIQIVHGFVKNLLGFILSDQLNLEEENRFAPSSNDSSCGTKTCESETNKICLSVGKNFQA